MELLPNQLKTLPNNNNVCNDKPLANQPVTILFSCWQINSFYYNNIILSFVCREMNTMKNLRPKIDFKKQPYA
jgi:hypothetical protein